MRPSKTFVLALASVLLLCSLSITSLSRQGETGLQVNARGIGGLLIFLPFAAVNWLPPVTPTPTGTCTRTLTATPTHTSTSTCTATASATATPTSTATPTPSATPTVTATVAALLPGDILTRDDHLITFMEAHDALYVGDGQIIDALPDGGVQYRSLDGFVADADDYVIAQRLAEWSEEAASGALAYAEAHIGTPYDYAYFGGKDTEDRMYCSELVWRAYWSQGIDLDSNGGAWVWPGEIVRSPLLAAVEVELGPASIAASRSGRPTLR